MVFRSAFTRLKFSYVQPPLSVNNRVRLSCVKGGDGETGIELFMDVEQCRLVVVFFSRHRELSFLTGHSFSGESKKQPIWRNPMAIATIHAASLLLLPNPEQIKDPARDFRPNIGPMNPVFRTPTRSPLTAQSLLLPLEMMLGSGAGRPKASTRRGRAR